jgi:uncharacterized membrane protein YgcG
VSVAPTASGGSHVLVTAERPETLLLLQQDKPALQHALDQAGIPSQSRELRFSLAVPDPAPATSGGLSTGAGPRDGAAPRDGSGESSAQSGSGGGGGGSGESSGGGQAAQRQTASRWLRAGIDITA